MCRWRRDQRPGAGDAKVAGVLAATPRDGGALTRRCSAEVRQQRGGRVDVGHRPRRVGRKELGHGPRKIPVGLVDPVEDLGQPVRALRGLGDDPACRAEVERPLILGRDRRHRGRHRPAGTVGGRRDHPDAVVRRTWRPQRTLPERMTEAVGDRDRARRAGLLTHEAGLAFEDARLRLKEQRDQSARPLRQLALLVRVLSGDRARVDDVLEGPQHPRDDPLHRSTSPSTMSMEPRIATTSPTRRPRRSHGRICKFTNDGPRNFARNGFGDRPSLIM